ncbi:FHA domain-containing protein [Fusobacterium sp. PH5-44]|uniref:FHA domain-containing protein n=1 Tax=unclassified Fusobacterium TaxID=2648384 RepID=UPI003D1A4F76
MRFLNDYRIKREIRKYQDKELKKNEEKSKKSTKILWGILILIGIIVMYYKEFSWESIITVALFWFLALILDLFVRNYRLKKDIALYERSQNVRDSKIVEAIEYKVEQKRDTIMQVILKNEDGYDGRVWNLGRTNSMLIGKKSRLPIDIDLKQTAFSALISKKHAILNRTDKGWYIEDLGSKNGTGIQRYSDNRKIKVGNAPIKVQSGDIIYIATTALLLK